MKRIETLAADDGGAFRRVTPMPVSQPELIVDLSRLLSRVLHAAPTGVDRVEMAYARGLLERAPDRVRFAAIHPAGLYGRLPIEAVRGFLDHTSARWENAGDSETRTEARAQALRWLWRLRPGRPDRPERCRVLLQPSPNHLDESHRIAAKVARENGRLICMVHDLIPITHPEYARPGGAKRHDQRIRTIARHAHGVLTNSGSTRDRLLAEYGGLLGHLPVRPAPLGVTPSIPVLPGQTQSSPYFMVIGTIEPRKNHLLLLSLWRGLVEELGPERTPKLLIVGRRGWENENVIDMLERCDALRGVVNERGRVSDAELRPLVAGARAILMPSFAEGYGLPVAEALAAGTPVIASDLPAHREAGGQAAEYLHPLDGPGWREAILAYAGDLSPRRPKQLDRIRSWSPTSWDEHLDIVLHLADEVAQ